MSPHHSAKLTAVLLSVLALVACNTGGSGSTDGPDVTDSTVDAPATTSVALPTSSPRVPQPTTPTDPGCTSGDLADSEFGAHLRSGTIVTSTSEHFTFRVQENSYDSCADLSWVLLDGTLGSGPAERPAGTMVLFTGEKLVFNYQPPLYAGVNGAQRLHDNAVLVSWRHNTAPGASEESYELTDDHLRLVATSTPDSLRGSVPVIDFRNPPLDSQAGLPPAGNVHGSPYAAELPTGRYVVPLTSEHTLQCDLGRDDGIVADCWANFQAFWDEEGSNHVVYAISPAWIETDINIAPDARGLPSLARDGVYKVGHAVVDLREPNVAKIGLEPGQGVHISPGHVGGWTAP